jgi:hypothetical protein
MDFFVDRVQREYQATLERAGVSRYLQESAAQLASIRARVAALEAALHPRNRGREAKRRAG